uniref:F-box domain-containing protein n=1 Tax=Anopheles coluzzii TaxID=1518534 RepID=A0A6E8WCG0_ANOCL|nr:uncharacterized protein LOC120957053 [Anopheles coluzzii]
MQMPKEQAGTMVSSSSECPIHRLPPELVFKIFDYLDLPSLKSVSLTCHRSEQLFAEYCPRRCILYIAKRPHVPIVDHLKKAAKMLLRTKRTYRSLQLHVAKPRGNKNMQAALGQLLEPRLLQQLVVLKLDLAPDSLTFAAQLSGAVAHMDRLQELTIRSTVDCFSPLQFSELRLANRSLHKLVLGHVWPGVIDCPNLRLLEATASLDVETIVGKQYAQHGGREPHWKLNQLEELVIVEELCMALDMENRPGYKVHFFRQLTQLKRLHCNTGYISERIFQAIGESCVLLEDLSIASLHLVDPSSLRVLANLTRLRQLAISHSFKPIPLATVVCLPSLERLLLGRVVIDWQKLPNVQSLQWLKIKPYAEGVRQLCDALAGPLKQLHCLWIDFCYAMDTPTREEILAVLPTLPALQTLVLQNVYQLQFLKAMPPLAGLTQLVVFTASAYEFEEDYTITAEVLAQLVPNARRVEIGSSKPLHDNVFTQPYQFFKSRTAFGYLLPTDHHSKWELRQYNHRYILPLR